MDKWDTVHKDQRRDYIVLALRSLNHDSVYNDNIYDIFKNIPKWGNLTKLLIGQQRLPW